MLFCEMKRKNFHACLTYGLGKEQHKLHLSTSRGPFKLPRLYHPAWLSHLRAIQAFKNLLLLYEFYLTKHYCVFMIETLDSLFQLPFYPPSGWKKWNAQTPHLPDSLAVAVILPTRCVSRRRKSRDVLMKVTWRWVSRQGWPQHFQHLICGC